MSKLQTAKNAAVKVKGAVDNSPFIYRLTGGLAGRRTPSILLRFLHFIFGDKFRVENNEDYRIYSAKESQSIIKDSFERRKAEDRPATKFPKELTPAKYAKMSIRYELLSVVALVLSIYSVHMAITGGNLATQVSGGLFLVYMLITWYLVTYNVYKINNYLRNWEKRNTLTTNNKEFILEFKRQPLLIMPLLLNTRAVKGMKL